LALAEPGARRAVDAEGRYLGALKVDRGAEVLAALSADLAGGDATIAAEDVVCGPRARHPARTPEERRRADAWQFELIHKPLDNVVTRYFYRTLSRPLTRMFLLSPLLPNHITLISTAFALGGCAIAAGAGYGAHVLGLALLVFGGVMDANDGEVARLRLEFSKLGGWLDTIGDELARLGVMIAVTLHVAPRWPDLPVLAFGGVAVALNLAVVAMIYWYCIFLAKTSNSQEYGKVLGVGPGVGGERTFWRKVSDFGADLARRDVLDLAMLVFASLDVPEISFVALVAGATVSFCVVLPAHVRLVKSRRGEGGRESQS
jgi:phosphatidylglycerophosphate synthase